VVTSAGAIEAAATILAASMRDEAITTVAASGLVRTMA